ncbi:MAG: hypothetical protein HZB10_03610 [Candidatus Yonathbacteria bacterium]|nr:hypothetical protein [Candidatus Yonathbacteria bacterium]
MKKAVTKKMTIDDLAIMVAKGFDGVYKEIGEVKKDIAEVKEDMVGVKKDIAEVKENMAGTRRDVLSMGDKFTLKYELHDLANRVVLLEKKRKVSR